MKAVLIKTSNSEHMRQIIGGLVGTLAGILLVLLLRANCYGLIAGVVIAANKSKVTTWKKGAILGAIIYPVIMLLTAFWEIPEILDSEAITGNVYLDLIF